MAAYERFAGVYDRLNRAVDYDRYGAYLCGLLERFGVPDGLILDLACGTGQMAVRLARRGYELIGVDASVDMLCQARETLAAAGTDCLLLNQRMEELDLYGTVRGCVCTFDSLNHLPDLEAVRAAVARVALFLEPDGVFIFDVNTPFKHEQVLGDRIFVLEDDGCYLVWQNAYEPGTCTVELTLDLFEETQNGLYRHSTETFAERAYPQEVLVDCLERCGLRVEAAYDELRDTPPRPDSERIYFVARKC